MHGWWVADIWKLDPVLLGSWVVWVIVSIVLHELGHGVAAIRVGDRTPIETGHMTWNPVVHMGPMSLVAFALFGFTWGAMPVDPTRFRGRYAETLVAAAGPAVNLILAVVCIVADALWVTYGTHAGAAPHFTKNLHTFLWTGALINVMGVMFNLVPVPPLDGSKILANLVPAYERALNTERGALAALIAFGVLFTFGSKKIWAATAMITHTAVGAFINVLGGHSPGSPM